MCHTSAGGSSSRTSSRNFLGSVVLSRRMASLWATSGCWLTWSGIGADSSRGEDAHNAPMRPSPLPVAFSVFGLLWGAWQAVLPDLALHYELSSGPLGAILTAGFAVSLPAMLLTGRLLDRLGVGWGIGLPAMAMALGLILVGVLPSLPWLVVSVVLFASGSGAYDVAINGTAMGDGTWSRPARLTLLHAAFSGGGVAGALGGGVLIGAGVRFETVYPVLAVCLVAATLLTASARS